MNAINTTLLTREASVTGRYSEMDNSEFSNEFEKTWAALNDVRQIIEQHVDKGNLKPIDAIRGFSALSANVLGYEEFVPRGNNTPVISPN